MKRTAFYVSDRTGISAEMFGRSLLTQFAGLEVEETTVPFVDTEDKAHSLVERISRAADEGGSRPLVFGTLVSKEISEVLRSAPCLFINYFESYIGELEREIGLQASRQTGTAHSIGGFDNYQRRIDAINFTIGHDDGSTIKDLETADLVLVGVSRCGKTPTCLYMAIHFGIFAANYPLIPEDLEHSELPKPLAEHRKKLYGLTISADQLSHIRRKRRPDSGYASLANCEHEVSAAERLMRLNQIPSIDVTHRSVEEISAKILQDAQLKRHIY